MRNSHTLTVFRNSYKWWKRGLLLNLTVIVYWFGTIISSGKSRLKIVPSKWHRKISMRLAFSGRVLNQLTTLIKKHRKQITMKCLSSLSMMLKKLTSNLRSSLLLWQSRWSYSNQVVQTTSDFSRWVFANRPQWLSWTLGGKLIIKTSMLSVMSRNT